MLLGSCTERADDVIVADVGGGLCGEIFSTSDNAGGGRDKREESGVVGSEEILLTLLCND